MNDQVSRSRADRQRRYLLSFFLLVWSTLSSGRAALAVADQPANEAQEHAAKGLDFLRLHDPKNAEIEMRRAVELSPDSAEYLGDLGVILGMEQKLKESTFYLEKALKFDPNSTALRRNLASNQWQLGHPEQAKQALVRILHANPRDARTILLLGMVDDTLKDYADAAKLLDSVRELVQQQPDAIAALARALYNTGEKERAQKILESLETHPAGPWAVFLGGNVAADAHDYATAEKFFNSIQSTYPDPATLGNSLALVQFEAGHFNECQETLLDTLGKGYRSNAIFNLLAMCLLKSADPLRATEQVAERLPRVKSDYLELGRTLEDKRMLALADVAGKLAVKRFPASAEAYALKGTIELDAHSYLDAVQSLSRALDLDPSSAVVHLELAQAFWGGGMKTKAAATFESGLKRFPHDSSLYVEYARMLLTAEETTDPTVESRAVGLLTQAIAIDPSQPEPHYQLGKFLLEKGKTEDALKELKVAARVDANNSGIHFSLARAYRQLGRKAEADKEFQYFQKLKTGGDPPAHRLSSGNSSPTGGD